MKMKKMEAEMEQVFEMKVKEKKQKLKDSEAEVGLVCVFVCVIFGGIKDLQSVHLGRLMQLGTKAVSSNGKRQIWVSS